MPPKEVYVGVVGTGGVGKAFVNQLTKLSSNAHLPSGIPAVRLIILARSSRYIAAKPPYSKDVSLSSWEAELASVPPASEAPTGSQLGAIEHALFSTLMQAPGPAVLVDNTASTELVRSYPKFLEAGISVVTPNKKGFSGDLALWDAIQAAVRSSGGRAKCYHESSVGAGLPILSTLNDLLSTGDEVLRIEGVVSGTLSFLFNEFAPVTPQGSPPAWSQAVKTAQAAGYTEPDPREDLNGQDVARKVTILARLCGLRVQAGGFAVESLIPKELESAKTVDEFLGKLGDFDGRMAELKEKAVKDGKVLRYVGSVDVVKGELKVGLQAVEKDGPIAGLKGSDNIVSFYTKRYADRPLVIQGAGAGADVTAMGVLADLLRVVRELD